MGSEEQLSIKHDIKIMDKLLLINEVYRNCYHDEPHLLNSLKRENGSKIIENHVIYDVIDTILNTWCCIEEMRNILGSSVTKGKYLLLIHGYLQCMYVQQDLMEELLVICKKSNDAASKMRKQTRDMRNELVGHPINTGKGYDQCGKLVSTSVWCWNDVGSKDGLSTIEYLYRGEGSIKKEEQKKYRISDLLDMHEKYMDYCLDTVLITFKDSLHKHISKKHKNVLRILSKEDKTINDLKTAARLIASSKEGAFQSWNNTHGYYSYENLLDAINKMNTAPRYKSFVDKYCEEVEELLQETGPYYNSYQKILKVLKGENEETRNAEEMTVKVEIIDDLDDPMEVTPNRVVQNRSLKEKTRYHISKLFEQKYYDDIKVLRKMLDEYPKMVEELDHMEAYWEKRGWSRRNHQYIERDSEMEYYAALLYLERMIEETDENSNEIGL